MTLRLIQRLIDHSRHMPQTPALVDGASAQIWTWARLETSSAIIAGRLAGDLPAGSVVLLCAANEPAFVAAFLGILRAGLKAFPVALESRRDIIALARASGAAVIVADEAHGMSNLLPLDRVRQTRDAGAAKEDNLARDQSQAALLLQSSGTTGVPKIVQRGGKSLDAVSEAMCQAIGFSAPDQVCAVAPLCHSYGIEHGLLAPIWAGSCTHLCNGFELATVLRQLASGITIFPGVPFMFEALAQTDFQAPALRRVYSAGGPLPAAVAAAFQSRHGLSIGQIYGATEIGSVTFNDPDLTGFDPASVGRAMRDVSIRIEPGTDEVAIRATSMFDGYLDDRGNPSRHAPSSYFLTGDSGRLDSHGNLFLTGRLNLLIDIGGRKVNPLEVENVLSSHPAVAECVVTPMTLSPTVRRLKAVVIPRDGSGAALPEELRRFAKDRLAAYKVPRIFEIRDRLPRSASGKVLRHLLIGILACFIFLGGCRSASRSVSPLPIYTVNDSTAALDILAARAAAMRSFSAQCDLTLSHGDHQTIELNGLVVIAPPDRLRLRAWKLDQVVFDLTLRPEGLWIETPPQAARGGEVLPAAVSAGELARELSSFTGGFFSSPVLRGEVVGDQFVYRRDFGDGSSVVCHVDRATLTPRQFEYLDGAGKIRFTLEMSAYDQFAGIPWPTHLLAITRGGGQGSIDLMFHDIEINGELAPRAFVPPPGAQRRP